MFMRVLAEVIPHLGCYPQGSPQFPTSIHSIPVIGIDSKKATKLVKRQAKRKNALGKAFI